MIPLAIVLADRERDADLRALAERLALPVVARAGEAACILNRDEAGLYLRTQGDDSCSDVRVDLRRPRHGLTRSTSLLARAVGDARGRLVVDATAGLGRDAHELAALGYRVLACERHPLLAALLRDALTRVALPIELREADARAVLDELPPGAAHAVCLDPMFPERSKRAAVKKESQLLQRLLGIEEDSRPLFRAAWTHASRVVVKRPLRAPPLAPGATFSVAGRAVRLDVYVTAGRVAPP